MTMKIKSTEFFPMEPRGNLECITSVPRDAIGDDGRALVNGLRSLYSGAGEGVPVGSDILVKILNADGDRLLHRRMFTVSWVGRVNKSGIDQRGIEVNVSIHDYIFEPIGDWWSSLAATPTEEEVLAPEREAERYVPGAAEAKWNPGLKTFEIKIGDEVLGTERDKDRALAVAAGSEPLAA